ncbi:MAG: hypothetical protein MRJ66_17540 [Nitrospira sp.]|nr:hypothetical protein [Nitrospira sp.]
MNYSKLYQRVVLAGVLVLGGLAGGCATVVAPLSNSDTIAADEGHGVLIGQMQLTWHTADLTEGITQPQRMKWTIEDRAAGKRFVVTDLPTDGSFGLRLPAGSYHLIHISFDRPFDRPRGVWHSMLPTTFEVEPRSCTSIGIWALQRDKEFSGWIMGQVLKKVEPAQSEHHQVLAKRNCPALSVPLAPSMRSKLAFQNRGLGSQYLD